jgi:hypothetical protein
MDPLVGYGLDVSNPAIAATPTVTDQATGSHGPASATFDTTRTYRYRLTRTWDAGRARLNFVMLNPSTADAFDLDPTVRRCVGFAMSWGFGSLEVTNLFAFRATDPAVLVAQVEPVGEGNDRAIHDAATAADQVIAAWGIKGGHRGRDHEVRALLRGIGVRPMVLGLTRDGHPAHPLYLRSDTTPAAWDAA